MSSSHDAIIYAISMPNAIISLIAAAYLTLEAIFADNT